jgi:hypothetical protein
MTSREPHTGMLRNPSGICIALLFDRRDESFSR